MKRTLLAVCLVVFCLAAVAAAPCYLKAREAARRQEYRDEAARNEMPLVLDAKTQAILAGADRVETFRLAGGGDEDYTKGEQVAISGPNAQYFENYPVLQVGSVQGKAFAGVLNKALSQASNEANGSQCYEPGIGFRVWKGAAHRDICVCFHCGGLEVLPHGSVRDDAHQNPYHLPTSLGQSRPALLALSRQAFPQDEALAALPNQL